MKLKHHRHSGKRMEIYFLKRLIQRIWEPRAQIKAKGYTETRSNEKICILHNEGFPTYHRCHIFGSEGSLSLIYRRLDNSLKNLLTQKDISNVTSS